MFSDINTDHCSVTDRQTYSTLCHWWWWVDL